jgi:hypothetical protein
MNGDYPAIWLDGQNCHVHRLVWEKYYGVIPGGYIVHHKDENKLNWDVDNLELLTRSEHLDKHRDVIYQKGVDVIASKDGLTIHFNTIKEAAEFCGTYTACIQNCFKGKQKQSNGWTFERCK